MSNVFCPRCDLHVIENQELRAEVDRVIKEHAECIDYYEAKLVECERKLDEAYASLAEGDKRYAAEVERLRGLLRDVADCPDLKNCDICRPKLRAALGTAVQPTADPSTNSPEISSGLVVADNPNATSPGAPSSMPPPPR